MRLAIITPYGTVLKSLNSTGLWPLTELEGPTAIFRPGCILSWQNMYMLADLPGTRIVQPEIIMGKTSKIAVDFVTGSRMINVSIETTQPAEMPLLIEQTLRYIGGKISTFDLNPTTPNSFVGGVGNDLRRLGQLIGRWCYRRYQRIKFGRRFAI